MRSDRAEFSKKTRINAWTRAGGRCEKCTVKITAANGPPNYDHIVPDAIGGLNDLNNCRVLCKTCHGVKTAKKDVPEIAKSERVFEKRIGARKPKGRPLAGTKQSGLRKRMDGTVERR